MDFRYIIQKFGEEIEIRRGGQSIALVKGLYRKKEKYIGFMPDTEVHEGDVLFRKVANQELRVTRIDALSLEGRPFERRAYFQTAQPGSEQFSQPQSVTINVETAYRSIIGRGSGHTLTASLDFSSLNEEIDRRGGVDVRELKKMASEVKTLLEQQNLPKGFLAKFGGLLKRHEWVIEPIAKAILVWATWT